MNPQIRKRQNLAAVYEALLQLMSQKPLSRISITELCQHAQVSRTYFYRNFTSFDQIILAYQKQAILQYLRQLPRQSKVKLQVLMTQYFTLMQQMAATNQLLIKNEKIQIFIQSFEAVFALLIKQDRIIGSSNARSANRTTLPIFRAPSSTYSSIGSKMAWSKRPLISLNRSPSSHYATMKVQPE